MLKPRLRVEGMAAYSTPEPTDEGPKMLASGSMCGTFDLMSHRLRASMPSDNWPIEVLRNHFFGSE